MAAEIRIYVEGGGDERNGRAKIRKGFGEFLASLREKAREKRIRWNITACGSRNSAFEDFKTALQTHPEAFNILLVDAEGVVNGTPWHHLQQRDQWQPPGVPDKHCHLMTQTMEAWFIADLGTLANYYGHGFQPNRIPQMQNVESIPKANLEPALVDATRHTQKGKYHKIRHGSELLEIIDPNVVKQRATYCQRLFDKITKELNR